MESQIGSSKALLNRLLRQHVSLEILKVSAVMRWGKGAVRRRLVVYTCEQVPEAAVVCCLSNFAPHVTHHCIHICQDEQLETSQSSDTSSNKDIKATKKGVRRGKQRVKKGVKKPAQKPAIPTAKTQNNNSSPPRWMQKQHRSPMGPERRPASGSSGKSVGSKHSTNTPR